MSRNDKSSGKTYGGRQGGGERKPKGGSRGNSPDSEKSAPRSGSSKKSMSRGNAPIKATAPKAAAKKDDGIRLNKYVSNSGVCSRRDADIYIAAGNITVNGKPVTEMGYKVKPGDEVKFDGQKLNPEKPEYILLNKPRGFYTTEAWKKVPKQ
jgi:23S rRNA pseudouridine2605 synthase